MTTLHAKPSRRVMARKLAPAIDATSKAVDAALANEQVTRERVDALEAWATAFTHLTRWERLRWLVLGR